MSSPLLTLRYFNFRGTAQPLRYLLQQVASDEWQEKRIVMHGSTEWSDLKKDHEFSPFGQLPVLSVRDGEEEVAISQVIAIALFLARKYNLMGSSPTDWKQIAKIESLVSAAYLDVHLACLRAVHFAQQPMGKTLVERMLTVVGRLEDWLKSYHHGEGFFVEKDMVTVADLFLFSAFEFVDMIAPMAMSKFPHLQLFRSRFAAACPKIVEYQERTDVRQLRMTGAPQNDENVQALRHLFSDSS